MVIGSWRRGLYRRFALGFTALVALIIVVEAIGLVWFMSRWHVGSETDVNLRLAVTNALSAELARDLEANPDRDLVDRMSRLQAAKGRVFVIMKDGRTAGAVPAGLPDYVLPNLRRLGEGDPVPLTWERSIYGVASLVVHGRLAGIVGIVPPTTWQRFGPLFVALAVTVVALGILACAILVTGPIRSRLEDLQRTAQALERGNLTARARADGSDEVAAVARAFNAMAAELSRRTTALERSNRLRQQLVADVSHELMTPLTAVLGHLETLAMTEVQLSSFQQRKHLIVASRQAQRLRRLVADMLDIARLESGGLRLECQELCTASLVEDVASRHELECRRRHITVEWTIAAGAEVCWADPFRMEQVLENLMTNALRHTPEHGRITLSAEPREHMLVFALTDSGSGIPAEHLPFIFDRFYKAGSSASLASPGSGLGLAIVKAIAERHDGHVMARSTPGVGTTVAIAIPLRPSGWDHVQVTGSQARELDASSPAVTSIPDVARVRSAKVQA